MFKYLQNGFNLSVSSTATNWAYCFWSFTLCLMWYWQWGNTTSKIWDCWKVTYTAQTVLQDAFRNVCEVSSGNLSPDVWVKMPSFLIFLIHWGRWAETVSCLWFSFFSSTFLGFCAWNNGDNFPHTCKPKWISSVSLTKFVKIWMAFK